MKLRSIIALALALLSAPAMAQTNPGTSPLSGAKGGTNNGFMQFTGPATSIKTFTLPNVSGTINLLESAQTSTATKTFAPTSGTTNQAIVSNGTLPSTGTSGASFHFNEFTGTNPGYTVTATTIDGFGGFPSTSTLRATYSAAGGSPINAAIYGASRQTAATANLTGIIGSSYSNISAPSDALWGMIGFTSVNASGNVGAAIAIAGESIAGTGAVIGARVGVAGVSQTNVQGTNLDAAFAVATGSPPGVAPYSTTGGWKYGFVLSRILYGNAGPPLTTNGKVMYADTAFTTTDFADMSAVTFTGKLFNFNNYAMDANGYTVLGAGTASLPSGDVRLAVTGASRGIIEAYVAANGASGIDGFQISNSANNSQMFLGLAEASNTTTRFGVTLGGYGELVTYSSNSNGLLLGTVSNKPVIIGVNNTAVMKLETSAGITVPPTVTGGDKGAFTINATGLYVAGNAVLTGNQVVTLSGDVSGSGATSITTTLATVNSNVGTFGSATQAAQVTVNAKGLVTAAANVTVTPAVGSITGLGTGVATALAINIGTAGSPVTNGGALGSPSSAGTMPAFTLGGTISGGGNQINNVVIGASSAGAGTFTTLTASTSTTGPIAYGGASAGSTRLINGTSNGSPANAYVNLQSNGQFTSIGNTSPKTYLDLNENLSSSPALAVATSLARMQAPDSVSGGQEWVSYSGASANIGNILSGATAGGTSASPSGTVSGNYLFNMRGYGYNSGWQLGAIMIMQAAEAWSSGHQGTIFDFYTTPVGSTTLAQAARIQASGGFSVGTTTDPGIGSILANKFVQSGAIAVASLPTCNAAAKGARYFVTDANSTTYHATAAGGGANNMGVTCDGTNWYLS